MQIYFVRSALGIIGFYGWRIAISKRQKVVDSLRKFEKRRNFRRVSAIFLLDSNNSVTLSNGQSRWWRLTIRFWTADAPGVVCLRWKAQMLWRASRILFCEEWERGMRVSGRGVEGRSRGLGHDRGQSLQGGSGLRIRAKDRCRLRFGGRCSL